MSRQSNADFRQGSADFRGLDGRIALATHLPGTCLREAGAFPHPDATHKQPDVTFFQTDVTGIDFVCDTLNFDYGA